MVQHLLTLPAPLLPEITALALTSTAALVLLVAVIFLLAALMDAQARVFALEAELNGTHPLFAPRPKGAGLLPSCGHLPTPQFDWSGDAGLTPEDLAPASLLSAAVEQAAARQAQYTGPNRRAHRPAAGQSRDELFQARQEVNADHSRGWPHDGL